MILFAERHFHEKFLSDHAHAFEIWVHKVAVEYISNLHLRIQPQQFPSINHMMRRYIRHIRNFINYFLKINWLINWAIFFICVKMPLDIKVPGVSWNIAACEDWDH